MLNVDRISKTYGPVTVLSEVSFVIDGAQRAALVGSNGSGKTTLLRIIAGLEESDGGEVEIGKAACIGYLPQDTSAAGAETIAEYLRRVTGVGDIEGQIDRLNALTERTQNDNQLLEQLQDRFERLDGYAIDHRISIMLAGFGLSDISETRRLEHLSSGQKSKIALIGILLKGVDVLLLDEPTNNLDLPSLIWLEDYLARCPASALIVSHDRRFLDKVASKVIELDWRSHNVTINNGNYSDYLQRRAKQLNREREQYRLQQEEIERLTEQAQRLKDRARQGAYFVGTDNDKFARGAKRDRAGRSGRTAKAIEKRLEQMDKVEAPIERAPFELALAADEHKTNRDIGLKEVVATAGDFRIGPMSLNISYGQRIGVVGPNGAGKSTLLKVLVGANEPKEGVVSVGSGVRLGDMLQEHEGLPRSVTPLAYTHSRIGLDDQYSYNLLKKCGIAADQALTPMSMISPGQRARLLLAVFVALSVNVLVLDEPTNHLDLEAVEALEEALQSYSGTIVVVSHDRYFLERLALDAVYMLKAGRLQKLTDLNAYLRQTERDAERLIRSL